MSLVSKNYKHYKKQLYWCDFLLDRFHELLITLWTFNMVGLYFMHHCNFSLLSPVRRATPCNASKFKYHRLCGNSSTATVWALLAGWQSCPLALWNVRARNLFCLAFCSLRPSFEWWRLAAVVMQPKNKSWYLPPTKPGKIVPRNKRESGQRKQTTSRSPAASGPFGICFLFGFASCESNLNAIWWWWCIFLTSSEVLKIWMPESIFVTEQIFGKRLSPFPPDVNPPNPRIITRSTLLPICCHPIWIMGTIHFSTLFPQLWQNEPLSKFN